MTNNIGETIAGNYLKIILNCDFVEYNVYTDKKQGEIDVIGIDMKSKIVYICEVAIHLVGGLHYVGKDNKSDNVNRFIKKFEKNIQYANDRFKGYEKKYMLWSPIVNSAKPNSKNNQLRDISHIKEYFEENHSVEIQFFINHHYAEALQGIKKHASKQTKELKDPVLRYMQVEERLKKHLVKLNKIQEKNS